MVATSGALPARAALLSLAQPPWSPEGTCSKSTLILVWVRLYSSTTSWPPRSADQKVTCTGPSPALSAFPPPEQPATSSMAKIVSSAVTAAPERLTAGR